MGGRLLALRWVLEGPDEMLASKPRCSGKTCSRKFPKYDTLAQQAKQIARASWPQCRRCPRPTTTRRSKPRCSPSWRTIGAAQELILREMAVRREPADMIFPPLRKTKDIQRSLPEGRLLLAFFNTSRGGLYGFLFSRDKYAAWQVAFADAGTQAIARWCCATWATSSKTISSVRPS